MDVASAFMVASILLGVVFIIWAARQKHERKALSGQTSQYPGYIEALLALSEWRTTERAPVELKGPVCNRYCANYDFDHPNDPPACICGCGV